MDAITASLGGADPTPPGPLPYADILNPQSLNKYQYAYNNPLRYIDPTGHDSWDFLLGAGNAFASNFFLGYGRGEVYNQDFATGQAYGDTGSVFWGGIEMDVLGPYTARGGMLATATGVGAPEGAAAIAGGALISAHGTTMATLGLMHLAKSATSGETGAAKAGREAHQNYDPGPGYEKEVRLPSGERADAVNAAKGSVRELKPNNPRAIKRGQQQVERYRRQLQKLYPRKKWRGAVDTYE